MSLATKPLRPSAIVLVAEDDVSIRIMAVDALTDAGFTVLEAGHADEALAILIAQAETVRALFADVHMPGERTGLALAHHVRGHWPWIALLVASGRARPASDEMPSGARFLPKLYHPEHVAKHVCELVGAE